MVMDMEMEMGAETDTEGPLLNVNISAAARGLSLRGGSTYAGLSLELPSAVHPFVLS